MDKDMSGAQAEVIKHQIYMLGFEIGTEWRPQVIDRLRDDRDRLSQQVYGHSYERDELMEVPDYD